MISKTNVAASVSEWIGCVYFHSLTLAATD